MVKHLYNILLGNFRRLFRIYSKEALRRYKICLNCEDKKYAKMFGDYCGHCGCPIKSKVTVEDEKCKNGKW